MTSVKALAAQYVKEAAKHKYTPPKASAVFACRQQSLAEGVAPLYIPLVRTNCLTVAEKNGLKVVRDGATVSTTNFTWATSGAAAERMELPFKLDWAKDAQYQVILLNTNNQEVATNTITCVATEANGFANPRYIGETNEYAFGEWTLDLAAATGGVWAANSYKQSDTGTVHAVEVPGSRQSFDWSTSNRYDTVYTNDYKFFANVSTGSKGHGPEGARTWTENVTWTFDFAATNLNTTIFTNDVRLFEQMKEENGEVKMPVQHFEYEFKNSIVTNYVADKDGVGTKTDRVEGTRTVYATNFCYYLITDSGVTTNRFDYELDPQTLKFVQTNIVVNLLTNELHKTAKDGDPVVESAVCELDYKKGVNVYYRDAPGTEEVAFPQAWEFVTTNRVVTNYVEKAEEIKPLPPNEYSVKFQYLVTNRMEFIVSPDKTATNLWGKVGTDEKEAQFNATNFVYYALTNESYKTACSITNDLEVLKNAVSFAGVKAYHTTSATTNVTFNVNFTTNYPSMREYVVNFDTKPAVTNLVASNVVEKSYTIIATNHITYVWSSSPSVTPTPGNIVPGKFEEADTNTYYDVTWDADPTDWEDQSKSYCETNRVYYVFNGSTTTNVCDAEQTVISRNTSYIATNYAHWVYRPENGIVSEYKDYGANKFTVSLTNTYTRVETNDYQYGYNEQVLDNDPNSDFYGRHGKSDVHNVQAFTLIVSGASTVDAELQAFANDVIATTNFAAWATNNNVSLVLLDCTNGVAGSKVGQGLLTHNHAGTNCYVSCKGLRAYAETEPAEGDAVALSAEEMQTQLDAWNADYRKPATNGMEIVLVRPDGTVAGRLAPQQKDGAYDAAENVARLNELLQEVDDKTEEANNGTATPLTFAWGETKSQTLAVSDAEDWFKLTGTGWTGKKVVFELYAPEAPAAANLRLDVVVAGQVVKVEDSLIWHDDQSEISLVYKDQSILYETNYVFSANDVVSGDVFVRVSAWDDASAKSVKVATRFGYTLKARVVQNSRGVVGFEEQSCVITQSMDPEKRCDTNYVVRLVRIAGSEGAIDGNVELDASRTTAGEDWFCNDFPTNVSWAAGKTGERTVTVRLKGDADLKGISNIVFTLKFNDTPEMQKVLELNTQFTISYGCNPTNVGELAIRSEDVNPKAADDGRVYVRYGGEKMLEVKAFRSGGKGPAAGYLTLTAGGKVMRKVTLEWPEYSTGLQGDVLPWNSSYFLAPNSKTGYSDAIVKLTSSNNFPIVKGQDTINVRVLAEDAPTFAQENVTWGDAVQYVAFSNAVEVLYGTAGVRALPMGWTVQGATKISGSLPTGLKVSVDKATGALVVTGTPTAAGETKTSIWWMKFKDAEGNVVMSSPVTLTIAVKSLAKTDANPEGLIPGFDQARAWTGLPLINETTKRLAGLLDMTVAKNGRTSARWRKAGGKTVAFSAASLTGCVQEGGETNVCVEATKTQSKVANEFNVTFWADGTIEGSVSEGSGESVAATEAKFVVPAAEVWSKTHTAAAWAGDYTLAFPHDGAWGENTLCSGATSLRVKFTSASQWNTGKATFAGTLPNGQSVSGTAVFVPAEGGADALTLPIFYSTAADTFGALVDVLKAGAGPAVSPSEEATNFWQHVESGLPGASYDNDYTAVGTRFTNENWEASWQTDYDTNSLRFVACGEETFARVTAKGATLKVAEKGELKALAFALNKTSGAATGTFRDGDDVDREPFAEGKTATWRGVALPGCPAFMTGAYWYTKVFEYEDAKGNAKRRSVKAGGAVSLEPQW